MYITLVPVGELWFKTGMENIEVIICALRDAKRVLITAHAKPDGDAIGSVVALKAALEGLGKKVVALNESGVPENLRFLKGTEGVVRPGDEALDAEVFIALDTANRERLGARCLAVTERIPIRPVVHYMMGGIDTDITAGTDMPGLYAAGETACCSLNGANRLGTNSLLDIVVFGKEAGVKAAAYAKGSDFKALDDDPTAFTQEQINRLLNNSGGERAALISEEMKSEMMDNVGIFRTEEGMQAAETKMIELRERYQKIGVDDHGKVFNTDLLNTWELGCLLDVAQVTAASAVARKESRGAHARKVQGASRFGVHRGG